MSIGVQKKRLCCKDPRLRATYLRKDASDAAEEKNKKLFNSCHARIVSSAGHADSRARQHSHRNCKNKPDPLGLSGSRCDVGVIPAEPSALRLLLISPTAGRGTRWVRQREVPTKARVMNSQSLQINCRRQPPRRQLSEKMKCNS